MNLQILKERNFTPKSILDIGCNVGQFYWICRSLWSDELNYFMVDGNESLEEDLKKINIPYKISILSDSVREVEWFSNSKNPRCTGESYYRENTPHYNDSNVIIRKKMTETLSNIFNNDQVFDLIKIDTQGSEIDVMKGGIELCKKAKFIILEVALWEYNLNAPQDNEVSKFMEEIGFKELRRIGNHNYENKIIQQDIIYENSFSL